MRSTLEGLGGFRAGVATTVLGAAVVGLAAARVARFLTTDWLGEWTVVRPLKDWAVRQEGSDTELVRKRVPVFREDGTNVKISHEEQDAVEFTGEPHPDNGWRSKLVKGLDCGYCITPWAVGGMLIANAVAPRIPVARVVWPWLRNTLALSYVAGHTWDRLDNR